MLILRHSARWWMSIWSRVCTWLSQCGCCLRLSRCFQFHHFELIKQQLLALSKKKSGKKNIFLLLRPKAAKTKRSFCHTWTTWSSFWHIVADPPEKTNGTCWATYGHQRPSVLGLPHSTTSKWSGHAMLRLTLQQWSLHCKWQGGNSVS